MALKIVWDEVKRQTNLAARQLDFALLSDEFFTTSLRLKAKLDRFFAIGPFGDLTITVVFKPLGIEAISVVSMRRASRKERKLYAEHRSKVMGYLG